MCRLFKACSRLGAGEKPAHPCPMTDALVRSDKSASPRSVEAVRALRDASVKFAIVSSRPPRGLKAVVSRPNVTMPVAGFNGGVIVSPDLSVVASYLIAPDVARHAVESGDRMLPAARIEPVGRLHWFIDRDAASA